MKHPRYEVLQDYFENALNEYHEKLVKEHLLNCDSCTKVLAQFSVIETRLRQQEKLTVSEATTGRIMADASLLLRQKREKMQEREAAREKRNLHRENLVQQLQQWRENIFPELKIPALQVCSLSLVLILIVAVEKQQSSERETYQPISTEVDEFTYKDIDQDEENS